jgi:hypothetical protein
VFAGNILTRGNSRRGLDAGVDGRVEEGRCKRARKIRWTRVGDAFIQSTEKGLYDENITQLGYGRGGEAMEAVNLVSFGACYFSLVRI